MLSHITKKPIIDCMKLAALNNSRLISVSSQFRAATNNIYNVQDEADFKKRVIQNNKPVIVDFHAV